MKSCSYKAVRTIETDDKVETKNIKCSREANSDVKSRKGGIGYDVVKGDKYCEGHAKIRAGQTYLPPPDTKKLKKIQGKKKVK